MTAPTFYLGAPEPAWLERTDVPLCVSDRRLRRRVALPKARGPWVCDSGFFNELQTYGKSTVPPAVYVDRVRRYRDEIGRLVWAAPQDWMCEDQIRLGGTFKRMTFVGTGLSIADHLRITVENWLELMELAPDLDPRRVGPGEAYIPPAVQGQGVRDYLACVELYLEYGVDLTAMPVVLLGSVCRREATAEAWAILLELRRVGLLYLHGLGIKTTGLYDYGDLLVSSDSQAWSKAARSRKLRLDGCTHEVCTYCLRWALLWRDRVVAGADRDDRPWTLPLYEPARPAALVAAV